MNIRAITLACSAAALAAAASGSSQVVISGTESPDKSATSSQATINTGDRTIVPLTKDTKSTKVDATTQRTESVTRNRLNDGSYFDSQRSTLLKKESPSGTTVSTGDVVEKDRQGQDHPLQHMDETIRKTAAGQTDQTKIYTRNSSGQLVLDHEVDATTAKGGSGASNTIRIEKVADVNGNLVVKSRTDEIAVDRRPGEKAVASQTTTVDHLDGQSKVTARETTTIATQGRTKQIDSVQRMPGYNGGVVSGRTITTETTASDGSVIRETIQQRRSIYTASDSTTEPIVPQSKIVEREVHRPDGTTAVQRDVLHRDVNGDWKPESFSTKLADKEVQP